ncbi:Uncharacterised protein [Escherichia coli]|nr:Uncharacterised protein [Escherichia coli]CAD6109845.1 Uncharacterised protein [Escherichia coli]CAD6554598.1 Uncharacterised protein [Escherichia coli]
MPENYPYSVNSSLSIGSINIKEGGEGGVFTRGAVRHM